MKMMLSDCAKSVRGKLIGKDESFTSVSIDTRAIKPDQLYIAIKGHNFDGNEFVDEAQKAGAIAAVVNEGVKTELAHIIVKDSRIALAEIAGEWRHLLSRSGSEVLSVVGITGSNGKTTTKEMVAAILGTNAPVLFTQGNLNNDIGVPLTLLKLNEQHRYAVIEMGANHAGEIAYTSQYVDADVVIITNAGAAHLEGFISLQGVAKAKGEIIETLRGDGVAVINHDDDYFDYWKLVAGKKQILSFGLKNTADITATSVKTTLSDNSFFTKFTLVTPLGSTDINLQLAGQHNVLNALASAAACIALNIDLQTIKQGLESIKPVTGRLQPLVSRLGNIVIDDTYNGNSTSLKAGLDVLAKIGGKPWLVLGAFGELGAESLKIHEEIAGLIKMSGVIRLMAVGADSKRTVQAFGEGGTFFETQQDLIAALQQELQGDETILIKGSRAQHMENVAAALVENFRN
jgi:UDP-N-acetylmuramoyl-tripeptide--D-alanyl-D-alanine ligase